MIKSLVIGPGYVGGELVRKLCAEGADVTALSRSGTRPCAESKVISHDISRSAVTLSESFDCAVYAVSAGDSSEESYRASYVDGVRNALTAFKRGKFIFISSTGVYGQRDGEIVDEESEAAPDNYSGKLILEGERLVLERGGIVLRFSGIYGPGREWLLNQLRSGKVWSEVLLGSYTNRIHREDCVGAIRHLMAHGKGGEVYIGSDDYPATYREVLSWLAERMKVPLRVGEDGGGSGRGSKRCSNRKLRESGYQFSYPSFREGYGEMLRGS